MKDKTKSGKNVHIIIAAMAVGFAVWAFYYVDFGGKIPNEIDKEPKIVKTLPDAIAVGFPSNIKLNAKIGESKSYSVTYPNSSVEQATVEFTSTATVSANFNFYSKWARDNSWIISNSKEGDDSSSLYLKKMQEEINITIKKDKVIISHVKLQ